MMSLTYLCCLTPSGPESSSDSYKDKWVYKFVDLIRCVRPNRIRSVAPPLTVFCHDRPICFYTLPPW